MNYQIRPIILNVFFGTLLFSCQQEISPPKPPNILLIVADDLGYADLGSFGGDIDTPHLDELANQGIRFSRFHSSPLCATSRAMFLTGNNNHVAGMGIQGRREDVEGYEGYLSERIITIPQLLQTKGYHTYMAGKWHLGAEPEYHPGNKGFEKYFITPQGGANHYNNFGILPQAPVSKYYENGTEAEWPEGAYSTDFYTDKLIEYIGSNAEDGKPFFTFAAYTSPHWPLQVDEKYWKKYEGRYDAGYEELKRQRFESLKEAGMIPEDALLPPSHPNVKAWDSLSSEEQKMEARKMELYAGMVDNLDYNIGRLIQYLKEIGEYENTLIVFMSDNGAAAEDFYYEDGFKNLIRENHTDAYADMGKPNSFISYGPQWAEAGSSPFKYYKGFTTEGGMNVPMIISGPGVENKGSINDSFLTLLDLAPTFYEVADAAYPVEWNGKAVKPLLGASLLSVLTGKKQGIHAEDYVFGMELNGYALLRKGNWKLLNTEKPFDLKNFELYNLETDLSEQQDMKEAKPEKYQELLLEWDKFCKQVGIVSPSPKQGEGIK
ncbi:arylsulfatase [Aquiflexum sp. LQ15W]|uniref:arylsulfatase n=1 Tax=Cognataquiflexum nitidum TaxID=2922272 RepID=UPI001F13A1A2|nr:arylsulfatase [Cognataquiflexum nitidum]MCH6202050.1 arylsulfatase [Cognataquiflexum nitidum]